MKLELTVDGKTETVDVEVGSLTLQEACDVEDVLGSDGFAAYQAGQVSPKVLRAVLWAKLRRTHPQVSIDDFDMNMVAASDAAGEEEPGPFENPS